MDALLMDWVGPLFSSTWIYPIVVAFVAMDGAVPIVPGEAVVITAAVLGADSQVHLGVLMLAALCGSIAGDTASYGIGRLVGAGIGDRVFRSGRRADAHRWATDRLHRRGGIVLIGARFLPAGRTATTLCAGTLRYPFRRFLVYTTVAGAAWSVYTVALGVLAGGAFSDRPAQSILLGLVCGVGLSMCFELVRRLVVAWRARRRAGQPSAEADAAIAEVADNATVEGATVQDAAVDGVAVDGVVEEPADRQAPDEAGCPILLEPPTKDADERE